LPQEDDISGILSICAGGAIYFCFVWVGGVFIFFLVGLVFGVMLLWGLVCEVF